MKKYATYRELPEENQTLNSRKCYVGAERVRDIVNDYDPVTYRLPYEYENRWFPSGATAPIRGVTASWWTSAPAKISWAWGSSVFTPGI